MLHGSRIALRARAVEDVDVLHAELYDDVALRSRADPRAWRPHPRGVASPFAPREPVPDDAPFSVVLRDTDELLGSASLWGIDQHNRLAHLGMALRPACRGQGFGKEAVDVLCRYGFVVLGLHRLQIETLADNAAMIGAAEHVGFLLEGRLRASSWVEGSFVDDVLYGLLADEWLERDAQSGT
jgi:RimJ/RimL family protein N-acetyltransferase